MHGELFMGDANVELHGEAETNSGRNIENGSGTQNSKTTEGDVNGRGSDANVHGKSFMSDYEGHYTSEDSGSYHEREFEGYSNFCRDDYMDYGESPPEVKYLIGNKVQHKKQLQTDSTRKAASNQDSTQEAASNQGVPQEATSNQGVAHEAVSNQGAGAKFEGASTEFEGVGVSTVGLSGDEFEHACATRSASAKQGRAHTGDDHIEPNFVDPLLGDPQCRELNSNPGSSDDQEQPRYKFQK
ncbi:hypothetical protein ACH5RR_041347 [Cinchona calisaya]|uniref:Uncharacterized protein n=1 Tax=Cinchona calisaya TaxID=153742 RepID=A0ABD2XXA0_9GENT